MCTYFCLLNAPVAGNVKKFAVSMCQIAYIIIFRDRNYEKGPYPTGENCPKLFANALRKRSCKFWRKDPEISKIEGCISPELLKYKFLGCRKKIFKFFQNVKEMFSWKVSLLTDPLIKIDVQSYSF